MHRCRSDLPLSVEDAVEGGPPPVLPRQGEDGSQVVEIDVTLWEGALQPGFLEGGPLLLQGPGSTQIALRESTNQILFMTNDYYFRNFLMLIFLTHRLHSVTL